MSLFYETPKAAFSPCRKYRYTLWRSWGDAFEYVNFICLNPSTADDEQDDPTIRKCVKFTKRWGYSSMCVTNLFAYRATDPREMKGQSHPVGSMNDAWIARIARDARMVICAWGRHGAFLGRSEDARTLIDPPFHYLRMGKVEPWHPLYLPDASEPIEWNEYGL